MKPCECGCGCLIPVLTVHGKPARFKHGHNAYGRRPAMQTTKVCETCGETFGPPREVSQRHWESRRFCSKDCDRPATLENLPDRFWSRVDRTGDCWIWLAGRGSKGLAYGRFRRMAGETSMSAHRIAYEMCIGPIPEGLHIDHLCCTALCVNPAHLEAVTPEENRRRQWARLTHCKHGHPLSGENLRIRADGRRCCRICRAESNRRAWRTWKAKQAAA